MTLTFIQGHTCVSNLPMFYLYCNTNTMEFKLGMTVDVCMAYMPMLVSVILTLMQGHSEKSALSYLDN